MPPKRASTGHESPSKKRITRQSAGISDRLTRSSKKAPPKLTPAESESELALAEEEVSSDDLNIVGTPKAENIHLKKNHAYVEVLTSQRAYAQARNLKKSQSPEPTKPPPSPSKKLTSLPTSLHNHLNSQRTAILRAVRNPPEPAEDEDDSDNEETFQQLTQLLAGTVERGEGNSCLLLGPRGTGKTRLVDRCLSNLTVPPIVIRLSGWSQTNDRLALREIAWQLATQTGTPFEAPENTEQDEEDNPFIEEEKSASKNSTVTVEMPASAYLPMLIATLTSRERPCVVILDAFDLFALHSRQSLIYCLLDTVQIRQTGDNGKGLLVVGLTGHIETINTLEKRVKSRFSGRMMRVAPLSSPTAWNNLARIILTARAPDSDDDDNEEQKQFQDVWKQSVDAFLAEQTVQDMLLETFSISKDVRVLLKLLTSLAVHITPTTPYLSVSQLKSAIQTQRVFPRFPFLHDLSYPSLCLLIAFLHAQVTGQDTATFEMLHETVQNQIRSSTSAPVQLNGGSIGMARCTREVLSSAFEGLTIAHIFIAVSPPSISITKEFIKFRCAVDKEELRQALEKAGRTDLKKWFSKL